MQFAQCIKQMEDNARSIRSLTAGVGAEQARWKPASDSWSILEVINHLYDEEREDFRYRLDWILHHNGEPWRANDPQGWVTERKYNERNFEQSVNNFLAEREQSIAGLRERPEPDWSIAYTAPWGTITAGDMFVSWVAHDLLHLRQLVELHWAWTARAMAPHSVAYAGEW